MISIFSPSLNPADSYGIIAHQLEKYLCVQGEAVQMMGFDKAGSGYLYPSQGVFHLGWPTVFGHFPEINDGPRIAVTMFESSKIPDTWAPILNTMDAVITPSRFCEQLFRDAGATVPIHMFPLGISEVYKPVQRKVQDKFTFLTFMDRGRRKGGQVALQAFLMAFGNDPRYQLIIKMRKPGKHIILFDNPNIRLIQQDMSEPELYDLYAQCDCLIAPTHGEGFGLLPREFAATGGVALATNWGGTADDLPAWGWPLPYKLGHADWTGQPGLEGLDLGDWAIPDVEGIAAALKRVADKREFYLHNAWEQAGLIPNMYSWRRFCSQVHDVYQELR
jgi:glycosyltransferase involved in cell wall biosynthesis